MGADIHIFAEVRKDGKWVRNEEKIFFDGFSTTSAPFDFQHYGMFGFLSDVRNYSCVPVLGDIKGLPDDSEWLNEKLSPGWIPCKDQTRMQVIEEGDYYGFNHYTLKELLDFDYDKTFENRRTSTVYKTEGGGMAYNGAAKAEEGDGEITTFRDFFGEWFFGDLEILKTLGEPENVRIIFWFD